MLYLAVVAKDEHQATVEMTSHAASLASDLSQISLEIIDCNSKYPYRSYFYEGWSWASIRVQRYSRIPTYNNIFNLLRHYSSDADLLGIVTSQFTTKIHWDRFLIEAFIGIPGAHLIVHGGSGCVFLRASLIDLKRSDSCYTDATNRYDLINL